MRIKVQIIAAINNTSPRDREVRTDEFIVTDDSLQIPETHRKLLQGVIDSGYSIENLSFMNETQSRIVQVNSLPQSLMFTGITLEQVESTLKNLNLDLLK